MSSAPQISVVVPTYNRAASVERLLEGLRSQTIEPAAFEVIVVVDGSDDGTRERVEARDDPFAAIVHWQRNRGRAAARNAGIARARGELIVMLDDDMGPTPHLLEAHQRIHRGPGRLAAVGAAPVALDGGSSLAARYVHDRFAHHLALLDRPGYRMTAGDFYSGNCSIRRAVLDEVGGFDEAFVAYGNEDAELALRLLDASVEIVYMADAVAHQRYLGSFDDLARDTVSRGETAVIFSLKHAGEPGAVPLGADGERSCAWRVARRALLAATRHAPVLLPAVVRAAGALAGRLPARRDLLLRPALDYCYWLGVERALRRRGLRADALRGDAGDAATPGQRP